MYPILVFLPGFFKNIRTFGNLIFGFFKQYMRMVSKSLFFLRCTEETNTRIFLNQIGTKRESVYATVKNVSFGVKEAEGSFFNAYCFDCVLGGPNAHKISSKGFFIKQASFVLIKSQSVLDCRPTNTFTDFFL